MNATNPNGGPFVDLAEATDRLFDRELSRDQREQLSAALSGDPEALRRFRETTDALLELRKPIDTPDVTAAVLARLDARPGFTTRRSRRLITTGRLAFAAALLGAGAGVLLLQQYPQPDTGRPEGGEASVRALDPMLARLYDPELAAQELKDLDLSGFPSAGPRLGLFAVAPSLDAPRLELDVTALDIWAGASDFSAPALLPQPRQPLLFEFPWASDLPPAMVDGPWVMPTNPRSLWDWRVQTAPAGSLLGPGLEFTFPAVEGGQPTSGERR